MKKYLVTVEWVTVADVFVEADSVEEASRAARAMDPNEFENVDDRYLSVRYVEEMAPVL